MGNQEQAASHAQQASRRQPPCPTAMSVAFARKFVPAQCTGLYVTSVQFAWICYVAAHDCRCHSGVQHCDTLCGPMSATDQGAQSASEVYANTMECRVLVWDYDEQLSFANACHPEVVLSGQHFSMCAQAIPLHWNTLFTTCNGTSGSTKLPLRGCSLSQSAQINALFLTGITALPNQN